MTPPSSRYTGCCPAVCTLCGLAASPTSVHHVLKRPALGEGGGDSTPARLDALPAAVWVVVLRAMQRAGSVRPPWAAGAGRSVDGRTCCRFALLHCNVYRNRIESKSRFFAKIESKSIENRNNHIVTSLEKIAIFDFDYRHRPSLPVYNFCPLHLPCLHSLAHPPIALYSARL